MKVSVVLSFTGFVLAAALATGRTLPSPAAAAATGTIKGHVRLSGKLPGNSIIRMGKDPKCSDINATKRVVQESVVAALDGSLANVFVRLQGTFPQTPAPSTPVTIDQRGCIYVPRVVGVRVGQELQIKNSDPLLHNVRSSSTRSNGFNAGQARAGVANSFKMKDEEVMLRLHCDLHSWMTAYIGVVSNPYFAVSGAAGTFEIGQVPAGTYMIQAWHERYGPVTKSVRVTAGATTQIEFTYSGNEPAPAAKIGNPAVPVVLAAVH